LGVKGWFHPDVKEEDNMYNLELRTRRTPVWNAVFDKEFDRLFSTIARSEAFSPACEIFDLEKAYGISLDIPGVAQEDISIEVKDRELHISGERRVRSEAEAARSEKRYGKFTRVFSLPRDVDADAIEARFENGVLDVQLPKRAETQARKIQISSARPADGVLEN
jgi:HSP20 family protein